jgi:hypothetical protein
MISPTEIPYEIVSDLSERQEALDRKFLTPLDYIYLPLNVIDKLEFKEIFPLFGIEMPNQLLVRQDDLRTSKLLVAESGKIYMDSKCICKHYKTRNGKESRFIDSNGAIFRPEYAEKVVRLIPSEKIDSAQLIDVTYLDGKTHPPQITHAVKKDTDIIYPIGNIATKDGVTFLQLIVPENGHTQIKKEDELIYLSPWGVFDIDKHGFGSERHQPTLPICEINPEWEDMNVNLSRELYLAVRTEVATEIAKHERRAGDDVFEWTTFKYEVAIPDGETPLGSDPAASLALTFNEEDITKRESLINNYIASIKNLNPDLFKQPLKGNYMKDKVYEKLANKKSQYLLEKILGALNLGLKDIEDLVSFYFIVNGVLPFGNIIDRDQILEEVCRKFAGKRNFQYDPSLKYKHTIAKTVAANIYASEEKGDLITLTLSRFENRENDKVTDAGEWFLERVDTNWEITREKFRPKLETFWRALSNSGFWSSSEGRREKEKRGLDVDLDYQLEF